MKPALAHSVMAAEPDAATTLLQLLYETLEDVAAPVTTQAMVLDLNTPAPEPEEEQPEVRWSSDDLSGFRSLDSERDLERCFEDMTVGAEGER